MKKKKKRCRSKSVVRSRKRQLKAHHQQEPSPEELGIGHRRPPLPTIFERYVRTENFLAAEEHLRFFRCLRSPLPSNFRIRSKKTYEEFKAMIRKRQVLAHQLPAPDRSFQLAPGEEENYRTRRWLSENTKTGNISRQEFVSMLPVFLLRIEPHHRILDLCASPGNKTSQAVDMLYTNVDGREVIINDSPRFPEGFCIANEFDPKRAYILAHRCRETLRHRSASLAVACHNATKFPNVSVLKFAGRDGQSQHRGVYDRIICDVPCSGDGTLRKDLKVWKTWHPSYGISLHPLQLRIAKRGVALLKVGGIMTYSTCSFHPIENEAIVAALLATGCIEILPPDALATSGIAFRSGLGYWKVLDDELEEVEQEQSSKDRTWPYSLWPPKDSDLNMISELSKCVRMVPQDNDTGGFFIALLRKVREFPATNKKISSSAVTAAKATPKAPQHELYREDEAKGTNESDGSQCLVKFKRSPSSHRVFSLSKTLAQHVDCGEGSKKLNLVYTGYDHQDP